MDSQEAGSDGSVGLLVLEPKSFRPFKTKDEYLYAMKEDLAEWFKCLYEDIEIHADNFLDILETGILLCQHANEVKKFATEQTAIGVFEVKSNFNHEIQIPQFEVQFRWDVKPGTFLARDNVSNFITWTTKLGIPEVLRFETDDLVMRKNERSVVLCLLEVARVGARFGMLAPTIVQMEEEIDAEIAGDPPPQIITCDVRSLDEMVRELVGRCNCPVQFPIVKVSEGKYRIGDSQTLVFVRILRKHVMIRVGGGWDTLEHYLDRHDPCRCNFQGHRQGSRAGPGTPRRASTTTLSQSQPNTPRSPRKHSLAGTSTNTPNVNARPASPSMRIASSGPGARKVLNSSQPGSAVTSPTVSMKQPGFPAAEQNGTTNRQPGDHVTKKSSASAGPTTPRRSASPAPRSQVLGPRRSQSPVPVPNKQGRSLGPARSQSPAPLSTRRSQSPAPLRKPCPSTDIASVTKGPLVSTTQPIKRCSSPVKQITLSDVRSSREQKQELGSILRRQNSTMSNDGDNKNAGTTPGTTSASGKPNITMDKISTMSLDEFKNLLNNALSVPNGPDSQCSSDSPRSQGSVDSLRTGAGHPSKKPGTVNSASKFRSNSVTKTTVKGSLDSSGNSNVDYSSSGYSSSSVSSEKSKRSLPRQATAPASIASVRTSVPRPRTPSGVGEKRQTVTSLSKTSAAKNVSNAKQTSLSNRPRTPTYKPKTQTSQVNNNVNGHMSSAPIASRSSSQSSLRSVESLNGTVESSLSGGFRSSQRSDSTGNVDKSPITPSSMSSDISCSSNLHSTFYLGSNANATEARSEMEGNRIGQHSNSEPQTSVNKDSVEDLSATQPMNVGYSSFSYHGGTSVGTASEELSDIDSEIMQSTARIEKTERKTEPVSQTAVPSSVSRVARPQTPSARPSTPSLIPRPSTPKMTRKMSLPQTESNLDRKLSLPLSDTLSRTTTEKPPTPRKANVIARSPSANLRANVPSKEKSYKEIFQTRRSTTPSPSSKAPTTEIGRRAITPGPHMQNRSNDGWSVPAARTKPIKAEEKQSEHIPLSVYSRGDSEDSREGSRNDTKTSSSAVRPRTQSVDRRTLVRQKSVDEPETVIMVNRSDGQHSITVQNEADSGRPPSKPKVLARARTETSDRSRTPNRPASGITRQRPQSVEPRALIPRNTSVSSSTKQNQKSQPDKTRVYDRTQEWVQTAVEQTSKVHKTKVTKPALPPKARRAMTPNSFDMKVDYDEPRSLDEIKAALSLPINGVTVVETDNLEAPPEDPEMYATMEKLFNELRQQELKASVNETPGVNGHSRSSSKQYSDSNDEEMSLDSNKNVKRGKGQTSRPPSSVTSPSSTTARRTLVSSTSSTRQQPSRPQTPTSSRPLTPRSSSSSVASSRPSPSRQTPPRQLSSASSDRQTPPRSTSSSERQTPPRSTSSSERQMPPRSVSSPESKTPPRSVSSSERQTPPRSVSSSSLRSMPPRPASTPPRPSTPTRRQTSRSSDDSNLEKEKENFSSPTPQGIVSKLKELMKVNPRKDKADGNKQRTRIPAPKSLASSGRSRSFSNLSNVSNTFTEKQNNNNIAPKTNGWVEDLELQGVSFDNDFSDGLSGTLSNRSETPAPRLATPLTTGRSTLIRKESMDRNAPKLVRAVSVERNISGLSNNYQYYDEGEYV